MLLSLRKTITKLLRFFVVVVAMFFMYFKKLPDGNCFNLTWLPFSLKQNHFRIICKLHTNLLEEKNKLALTLLWFDLFKIFQNLLTGKMAINISEPFKTLHNFLLLHYHTFQYHLKGRNIGLWYTPMIKVCLFRELFHLSKPFIGPFCQTVF